MRETKQTAEKHASEEAVLKALAGQPQATAADIASGAGVARSTASKTLARLASTGEVRRTQGGRDGTRRLPDRFALASAEPAAQDAKPRAAEANAADPPVQASPREGSTMWAAIEVLRGKRKPMRAAEIYAEIRERKLAPGLKGKTPEQTVAGHLAVNAKRGRYVERPEPGKFRLKSERCAAPAGKPKPSDEGGSR